MYFTTRQGIHLIKHPIIAIKISKSLRVLLKKCIFNVQIKNLPSEVILKLSNIFNVFLTAQEDAKNELAALLTEVSQENNIDLFKIFEDALGNQEKMHCHVNISSTISY